MEPHSPVKALRLLSGLTQKQLTQLSGLTATATINTEAALYDSVPHDINMALKTQLASVGVSGRVWLETHYGVTKLDDAMRVWQRQRRELTGQEYHLDTRPQESLDIIISWWPTTDRFVKTLCIPPAAVHQYRAGDVRTIPEVISTALLEAHYPWVALTLDEWKQRRSSPPIPA